MDQASAHFWYTECIIVCQQFLIPCILISFWSCRTSVCCDSLFKGASMQSLFICFAGPLVLCAQMSDNWTDCSNVLTRWILQELSRSSSLICPYMYSNLFYIWLYNILCLIVSWYKTMSSSQTNKFKIIALNRLNEMV